MATVEYQGKNIAVAPGQLILDSGMNVFGLHLFMESVKNIPDGVPSAFAFEHRGVRIVIDCDPEKRMLLTQGGKHEYTEKAVKVG